MSESVPELLRRIAQNDYMIDQHYLEDGARLMNAADLIENSGSKVPPDPTAVITSVKYVSATELKQSAIFPQPVALEVVTIGKALQEILESYPGVTCFEVLLHRDSFGTTVTATAPLEEGNNE